MTLRPFFPFYGSKWRSARSYGRPLHDRVVEPFAGSAGYATYWGHPKTVLVEKDPIIVGVWSYLIAATPREILALPDLAVGQDVRDLRLPQEAQWLIGFWLNRGSATPKRRKTAFSARTESGQLIWSPRARERIASQVESIRSWRVTQGDYADAPLDEPATWFVDPPYVDKGRFYRMRDVAYPALAAWCERLQGQVFVCENDGADWLPFEPHASIKSTRGRSVEVLWTNGAVSERLFDL